jgi:DNA-binding transcriptional ArsR family regulator
VSNRACSLLCGPDPVGSNLVEFHLGIAAARDVIINWPEVAYAALTGCRGWPATVNQTVKCFGGCMDELSAVFDALANEHRRRIIHALAIKPASISELAAICELSLPAIHKHIQVLDSAAMVRRRKVGRVNFLALQRAPLRLLQGWVGDFHPWWGDDSESLETYANQFERRSSSTKESP